MRDLFHTAVRRGLEKERWMITDDPLELSWEEITVKIDLAAERLIAAERQGEKITVEIKSFISTSAINDFHTALPELPTYVGGHRGNCAMDKLERYRTCIQALLEKHSHSRFRESDIDSELFFDPVRDHYQLMRVGWQGLNRIYHTVLHCDIKDGKIWLQHNTTDVDVGQELVDMGIPKEDIVLGLHPPYKRPYTGYGVA